MWSLAARCCACLIILFLFFFVCFFVHLIICLKPFLFEKYFSMLSSFAPLPCTDMNAGRIGDMQQLGITESYQVKRQVLISGAEAAEMIIRVDNIIRSAPRQRAPDHRGHWSHDPYSRHFFLSSVCLLHNHCFFPIKIMLPFKFTPIWSIMEIVCFIFFVLKECKITKCDIVLYFCIWRIHVILTKNNAC